MIYLIWTYLSRHFVSRHVIFYETHFPLKTPANVTSFPPSDHNFSQHPTPLDHHHEPLVNRPKLVPTHLSDQDNYLSNISIGLDKITILYEPGHSPSVIPIMFSLDNSSNDLLVPSLRLRKSTRLVRQPTYLQDFLCNYVLHTNHVSYNHNAYLLSYVIPYLYFTPSYQAFCYSISINIESKTYKQAS